MDYSDLFIGTPTHAIKAYCAHRFVGAVAAHAPGAEFNVLCNSREGALADYAGKGVLYHHIGARLDESHFDNPEAVHRRIVSTCNDLRRRFLESGRGVYLSLEADVILAADTLPRMFAAISDECPVVYANCYRWPTGRPFLEYDTPQRTDRITMGCTLMRREVLSKIEYRYDSKLLGAFPDAHFGHDCNVNGFGMWYDPSIYVEHCEAPAPKDGLPRGWGELPKSERWWRRKK